MKLTLDDVERTGEVRRPLKGEYYLWGVAQYTVVRCGGTATGSYPIVVPKQSKHFKVEITKIFSLMGGDYTETQARELIRDLQSALDVK